MAECDMGWREMEIIDIMKEHFNDKCLKLEKIDSSKFRITLCVAKGIEVGKIHLKKHGYFAVYADADSGNLNIQYDIRSPCKDIKRDTFSHVLSNMQNIRKILNNENIEIKRERKYPLPCDGKIIITVSHLTENAILKLPHERLLICNALDNTLELEFCVPDLAITGTYENLARWYLREARSCLKSKAYRMAILSSATAVYVGVYYILLLNLEFKQRYRIEKFSNIIEELKKLNRHSDVIDDCEWLMNIRNSIAHPEEILGMELDGAIHKIIDRIPGMPVAKKGIHQASMVNSHRSLRITAENALKKSEMVLGNLGISIECGDVIDWKTKIEQLVHDSTDQFVDLDYYDMD